MQSHAHSTKHRLVDGALLALLCLPFAVSSFALPWGRDQGIYAQAAGRMLDGFVPYTETFVFKPPGTLFVHALAEVLFGRGMLAIRLLDVGWTIATALLVAEIARRATGLRLGGFIAGVTYAIVYHQQSYWMSAQTDGWANLPAALGLVLLLAAGPRARLAAAVAAGLLAGVAFWLKYTTGGLLVVFALVPLVVWGRRGWLPAAGVLVGFVGTTALVVGALAWVGALGEFISIQTEVVIPYAGAAEDGLPRREWYLFFIPLSRFTPPGLFFGALGLIAVAVRVVRRPVDARTAAQLGAAGWALAGLLSAAAQGKFWTYQYLFVLGGLAVLVAIGAASVHSKAGPRWTLSGEVVALIAVSCFKYPGRWAGLASLVRDDVTLREVWLEGQNGGRGFGYEEVVEVSEWVAANTPEGEPVLVWGYDPMIYVLADRDMVGRFPYTYPMVVDWGPREAYRAELIAALEAQPPSAVVVGSRDGVRLVYGHRKDSWTTMAEFNELRDFLRRNYARAPKVGRFRIYVRKDLL